MSKAIESLTTLEKETMRTAIGLGTLATQNGTFSGTSSGTNTGDQTNITGNAATVTGLSITGGKTLTATNTITLAGTDGSTLTIGTGGTLGTAAFTAATAYATAAQGADERVPTDAGLTTKFSTAAATVVDADRMAIFDSTASFAPKHALLSTLWTWIKSKIGGTDAITAAGLWSFTTRPRSSAALTPENTTELVTLADVANYNYGYNIFPVSLPNVTTFLGTSATMSVAAQKRGALEFFVQTTASTFAGFYAVMGNNVGMFSLTCANRFEMVALGNAVRAQTGTNNEFFWQYGRSEVSNTAVQISARGFGMKIIGTAVTVFAHDGTTLTEGTAGTTASMTGAWTVLEFVPATGVYLYTVSINGVRTLIASVTTGIPTGSFAGTQVDMFLRNNGSAPVTFEIKNLSNLAIRQIS